ncbi:protein kinase domain-containing protein [Haliangium sp.]|uniref:WD40 repeat domain-containing serine/threonine protein kinase n=1 Tax=Haliangium sp. TaxID=2663208 RepID=UPI003D0D7D70
MERDDAALATLDDSDALSHDELTGRVLGDFSIEELIGVGGYGLVYRARQQALGREVVIKVLHHSSGPAHTERFLREARLASQLDHPYAAHIYAFGAESDGTLWIAMELVRGTPLDELIASQGPLPLRRFVPLLERICEVVYTAHEQGIVHRDIKPANVMVISRAGQLLPKLIDFGIARADVAPSGRSGGTAEDPAAAAGAGAEGAPAGDAGGGAVALTGRGRLMGSPHYMAPEQWLDASRADARTDQYALGILTYQALTGHVPFQAPSDNALALLHANRPVPALGQGLPSALNEVLARALAKRPSQRFGDVLALAAAFRAAAAVDGEGRTRLPQLDPEVREGALAKAPQPLADGVALLEAAQDTARALAASRQVVRVAVKFLGLLAMAALGRVDPGDDAAAETAREALRRLRRERLSTGDWVAATRCMLKPYALRPDVHPVPELVLLFFRADGSARTLAVFDELTGVEDQHRAGDPDDDERGRVTLEARLPLLAAMLTQISFLGEYPLLVERGGRPEIWMGARRTARAAAHLADSLALVDGEVVLSASDGTVLLALSPLCQVLAPAPGAPDELFLYDGPGRYGARLVAYPVGFERHDDGLWGWFDDQLGEVARTDDEDPTRSDSGHAPYLGLSAFSPADATNYFGREREVEACVNRLRVETLLAVVGPSGAGKSSFVQAGIIPALAPRWRGVTTRPGPTPLAHLATRLAREGLDTGDLRQRLERDPAALGELLGTAARARGQIWMLVVDQFEELVTLCHDPEEQRLYAEALVRAAHHPDAPVRLVLTLRDDFLVRVQQVPALRERLGQALQILGTPPPDELERIVTEPARRAGYRFEDSALPREMVAAVAGEPGALALLSFTAAKLWELRDRHFHRLTRSAYRDLGGVGGALAQHAEEVLAQMSLAQQRMVREAFRQLVTADGTRAILTRDELAQMLGGGDDAQRALEELIGARLLVASEGEGDEDRIEVVHEALLSSWPRLVSWQREDAEGARLRDQLRVAARQWSDRDRPKGLLWRGDALLEYRLWRARYQGSLTAVEEAFTRASGSEERRNRRRRQVAFGSAFVILVVGLVVVLMLARSANQRLIELYEEQGRQALAVGDPRRAFVYLAEALEQDPSSPTVRFLMGRTMDALQGEYLVLPQGDGEPVLAARFSPDGRHIATAGMNGTVKLWDPTAGDLERELSGHESGVGALRFSPDGARLLTGGWDNALTMWDPATGTKLWSGRHAERILGVAFSPDGAVVASAGMDRAAKLWSAADGRLLHSLEQHQHGVTSVAFSADGAYLLTSSLDGHARTFSVETGALVAIHEAHDGPVPMVVLSPDGGSFATASIDRTARIQPLRGGPSVTLRGHELGVISVDFSPDGARVVTASLDGTARIWDPRTGALVATLAGHDSALTFACFSPDGRDVLTVGRDGTAKRWDADTGLLRWSYFGHLDGLWTARFDASGARFITASFDGTARVWNAHQTGPELTLPTGDSRAASLAPDGEHIAVKHKNGLLRVWDTHGELQAEFDTGQPQTLPNRREPSPVGWSSDSARLLSSGSEAAIVWNWRAGEPLMRLVGHDGKVRHASYSADGANIVTAGDDGLAKIWDAATGTLLRTLRGHGDALSYASMHSLDHRVVTASTDETARIWDAASGRELATLSEHGVELTVARFSPDGARFVTAAEDKIARIWSDAGQPLVALEGHAAAITSIAFSPDGLLVISGSEDGTAKVWDSETGRLLWTLEIPLSAVHSVEFSADGRHVLVATTDTATLWNAAYADVDPERLAWFTRCRVGYELNHGRLVDAHGDPATCYSR